MHARAARSRPARGAEPVPGRYPVRFGEAELLRDADRSNGWFLSVGGVAQSYVDLDDPTYLEFDYVRWMADIIDCLPETTHDMSAVYVGGGACTLPRYVAATRPASRHLVFEVDEALVELVRAQLGLRSVPRLRVRIADGATETSSLRENSVDLFVVDAFEQAVIPATLATRDYLSQVKRVLAGEGLCLVNVADNGNLTFTKRFAATLFSLFDNVLLLTEPAILRGRRFGNVVLAATDGELPIADVTRKAAGSAFPARCLAGQELRGWCGAAQPFNDLSSVVVPSPPPAVLGLQGRTR